MSISIGIAAKQINRLSALRGWRDLERPAREELAGWLSRACDTEYQAQQAIERWLESEQYLPAPSDLHRLAREAPLRPPASPRSDECVLCRGAGRESYWAMRTVISRWPDSGRIRQQEVQRVPPWPGRENLYLTEQPRRWREDGTLGWLEEALGPEQVVLMVSGFCRCEYGQHLRTIAVRGDAA